MHTIVTVGWIFTTIYFVCHLGENVTYNFNVFNEELCRCDWYLFPNEMQRVFLIVLSGAQQPIVIQGYANIVCTHETFKKVIFFFFVNDL